MSDASTTPWNVEGSSDRHLESVNLIDGTTFAVSSRSGTIGEAPWHGLYLLDTRALSRWRLSLLGWTIEPLTFAPNGPFSGTYVARADHARRADAPVAIVQRRSVGRGMRDDIEIRNHGARIEITVRVEVATDLAGLFDVKAGRAPGITSMQVEALRSGLRMRTAASTSLIDSVTLTSSTPPNEIDLDAGALIWNVTLEPTMRWSTCLEVTVTVDGTPVPASHPCGQPIEAALPVARFRRWRADAAHVESDDLTLEQIAGRSVDDLGALRIYDPEHTDRVVVAAGAPWFMALFGRDSILASWMALPFDQDLAAGVLSELADHQGTEHNSTTEEQPGRILHEVRFDRLSSELLGPSGTYYGTIDATPLFVMLAAELARWTGVTTHIRSLMPAVDRALDWISESGDRDGDGFVEYLRGNASGLAHQGWKDSWDGIRHEDGSIAVPPIALCEVQGYVYAAYRSRAALAVALGEDSTVAESYERRATRLASEFDAAFWMDDLSCYAVGLDADKRPIRSVTSNIGHLLWSGIVPEHRAREIADHLVAPTLHSGWGLRTLSSEHVAYNPLSYHCGSVWPHDTALAVAGLSRYGFDVEAQRLTRSLLDAAAASDLRLPELFGGFRREDVSVPVPYPSSCSPQAWAAAAPLLLIRAMLGLDPDVPDGTIRLRARLPDGIDHLALRGVSIGDDLVDVIADSRGARVDDTTFKVESR